MLQVNRGGSCTAGLMGQGDQHAAPALPGVVPTGGTGVEARPVDTQPNCTLGPPLIVPPACRCGGWRRRRPMSMRTRGSRHSTSWSSTCRPDPWADGGLWRTGHTRLQQQGGPCLRAQPGG